jgi:NodT family efflux transporter outer membrane factor (OMF) lipoprotein
MAYIAKNHGLIGFMAIFTLLTGCASPPERHVFNSVILAEEYSRNMENSADYMQLAEETALSSGKWWEVYGSEDLNSLIQNALRDNPDINQIRMKLAQADAISDREAADLMPSLTVSGERATSRGDLKTPSDYTLSGAASFEIDLWSKNKAGYRSKLLETKASSYDVEIAEITLVATIVENWLKLMALREEETILHEQINTNKTSLDLQHKRYEGGISSMPDILKQKELLERSNAQLSVILSQQEITENKLAALAGVPPTSSPKIEGNKLPDEKLIADIGVPSTLLESRPDIKAAWVRLKSADWASEEARLNRLPGFNLSASYSTTATKISRLVDSWLLGLAAELVAPVIDGGYLRSEHQRQKAIADERLFAYKEAIINAVSEVENALSQNHHQEDKVSAVKSQLSVSEAELEHAKLNYINGNSSYIAVLRNLSELQELTMQLIREKRDLALNRIALQRSLGNRWEEEND